MNSSVIGNIAYIATVASTLVGVAILVGGTLFLVQMTRAFKATSGPPPVAHRREVDIYAVIYRAVLAREADAVAKGPRPPPLTAAPGSQAETLPKVTRRLELAPPSSSRPRPVPENICA